MKTNTSFSPLIKERLKMDAEAQRVYVTDRRDDSNQFLDKKLFGADFSRNISDHFKLG
jgi:hypothetical protein